jgi:hypothetical protein
LSFSKGGLVDPVNKNKYKIGIFLSATIFILIAAITYFFYIKGPGVPPRERPVEVAQVIPLGSDGWLLPNRVLTKKIPDSNRFIYRVITLRARKVPVDLLGHSETGIQIKKEALPSGALVIVNPQGLKENEAVVPVAGIDDRHLVRLVLEAGVAAIEKEDFRECLRFLSYRYQDTWGFNLKLIEVFLRRAFKEFSQPRVELLENPDIQVAGNRAVLQTAIRLRATYQGRSNYLLGDSRGFNTLELSLEKEPSGWKVIQVRGLKPLGFNERFLKLIGSEIGLPLNEAEQQERRKACMPCRERMAARFGMKK